MALNPQPIQFPHGPTLPGGARRIIGPIPPRDDKGRLRIAPIMAKKIRTNALNEPVRDERGNPIEELADSRDPRDYFSYEIGYENQIADGATKGLHLFQVDLSPEPLALVYAKNENDAVSVYKREFGITRFGERDPKVTQIAAT